MRRAAVVALGVLLVCQLGCGSDGNGEGEVVAEFSASPVTGDAPLEVVFTSMATGDVTGWSWEFGDGGTSEEENPVHTYAVGTWDVTLTVEGPEGTDTETKVGYIVVGAGAGPVADFEASVVTGAAPLEVTFTDLSTGTNVHAWSWDFGDEGTSVEQHPVYVYVTPGTYDVTLEVTDDVGSGTETKTAYIEVTSNGTGGTGGPVGSGTAEIPGSTGRSFAYYVPDSYSEDTPMFVLYTLHGSGGTATNMRDAWVSEASENGFIVVALQGSGPGWNPSVDGTVLQNMFNHVDTIYNIDTKHRYLHGYSAGAHWSYSLGLYNNGYFAAFAVFAGTMQYAIDSGLWPLDYDGGDRRIPVSIHHGDSDTVVPVSHARTAHMQLLGAEHPVSYIEIPGGTHAYPISINAEMWDFISTHALP
jgi:PKD repeat protein